LLFKRTVRRKERGRGVVRLRNHAVSRLSALSLIVLILLPFTAPFPTFELDRQSDSPPDNASLKDVKGKVGSDAQIGISGHSIVPPASSVAVAIDLVHSNRSILPTLHHAVLRI
jgi:hypothetical protein